MKLEFISLDKLAECRSNMRAGKKAPDVTDLLPSIRQRGVLVPLLVRPAPDDRFEVVAGRRRHHAALVLAAERKEAGEPAEPMPCAIMEAGDDAAALEASILENVARLDPDEVTRWEQFVRLVREGRTIDEIATTFGLPELMVRRTLALGNLVPRIRHLYRAGSIDGTTVRHLTMASKAQQRDWLALLDDPSAHCPTGHRLKAWLTGGQAIPVGHALFDLAGFEGRTIANLFGEEAVFADPGQFWEAQNAAIEARRAGLFDAGWKEVVVVPPDEHFHLWEHEKRPKRRGGRVYIDVRSSGEVTIHEGYVSRRETAKADRAASADCAKAKRPEIASALSTYIDLHRHATARAALLSHGGVALRLMLAHSIAGSPLWTIRTESQAARSDAITESVKLACGEALFDGRRREALSTLALDPECETVHQHYAQPDMLVSLFLRLLGLDDAAVMRLIPVVMGETLAAGTPVVEALGLTLSIDMADWWEPDAAFFDLIRDREVLGHILAEIGGPAVARAHADEKGKMLKSLIADYLEGRNDRTRVERWVPRWMAFPPSGYTERGGIGTVAAHAVVKQATAQAEAPAPETDAVTTGTVALLPAPLPQAA